MDNFCTIYATELGRVRRKRSILWKNFPVSNGDDKKFAD